MKLIDYDRDSFEFNETKEITFRKIMSCELDEIDPEYEAYLKKEMTHEILEKVQVDWEDRVAIRLEPFKKKLDMTLRNWILERKVVVLSVIYCKDCVHNRCGTCIKLWKSTGSIGSCPLAIRNERKESESFEL